LDVIIQPPFESLAKVIPRMDVFLKYIESTKEEWAKLFDEYDDQM
jgi:hypothetical protein